MQTLKECLQKVLFNSIKREERYHKLKLDVQKHTRYNRPGPGGGPTRGGPPKNRSANMEDVNRFEKYQPVRKDRDWKKRYQPVVDLF